MFKWAISEISISEQEVKEYPQHHDLQMSPLIEHYQGACVDTLTIKTQIYTNDSEDKPILSILLQESRSQKTQALQERFIVVNFGNVVSWEELNKLLGARKLDQVSSRNPVNHYKGSTDFQVKKILSTLNEISPFSLAMKYAILDYLLPELREEQRSTMMQNIFDRYKPMAIVSDSPSSTKTHEVRKLSAEEIVPSTSNPRSFAT